MTTLRYNTWLLNFHNKLNTGYKIAALNRDGGKYSRFKHDREVMKWDGEIKIIKVLFCNPPELVIVKNKLINRDISVIGLMNRFCKKCKTFIDNANTNNNPS